MSLTFKRNTPFALSSISIPTRAKGRAGPLCPRSGRALDLYRVCQIADHRDVSVDWLLGRSDVMEIPKSAPCGLALSVERGQHSASLRKHSSRRLARRGRKTVLLQDQVCTRDEQFAGWFTEASEVFQRNRIKEVISDLVYVFVDCGIQFFCEGARWVRL